MCGGVPDPLALWRNSVWTSPAGPLYAWSQRKEGGSSRTKLISSLNSQLKWMRSIGSLEVSISFCNGNVQGLPTETALHTANMNRSCWQWEAQWVTWRACVTAWPGLHPPVCTGSIASQMDGSWKLIWEDIHDEEWCLVVWNTAVGNILFGYVWQWDKRAVFGVGSFWINIYSPINSTGVNPYPGIQVDTNFYKLIQSGFKMDQPYYATKDV